MSYSTWAVSNAITKLTLLLLCILKGKETLTGFNLGLLFPQYKLSGNCRESHTHSTLR